MKTFTKIPKMLLLTLLLFPGVGTAQNPYENILIMHNAFGPTESTVVIDVGISNYVVVLSFQFDVPLPPGFTYVAGSAVLSPARRVDHLIYSGILTGTNILRIGSFSLTNLNFIGNSGIVASYTLNTPGQTGIYNLNFVNPIMMGGPSGCYILTGVVNGTVTITQNTQLLPGDANCNGLVNVMDVLSVINHIIGNNPQTFCFENADVNGDGIVNVIDVVDMINIIMN